ncbi:hypothetical protein [Amycolatopsis sp. w19]|uniref:hypothetical protein n=1 Tax=Amycolatopsis sp. w19 TaxID=3448134 RepID=UPI003F1C5DCB
MSRHEETDRALAWELHVELASRITAVELRPDEGLLSEALDSLYSVFSTARRALAGHRPAPDATEDSVHHLVINLLNKGIRPFLAYWHRMYVDHQDRRPAGVTVFEHEQAWEHKDRLRAELADLQVLLRDVARRLAELAEATSLLATAGGAR